MIDCYENKKFKLNYDLKNHKKGDRINIRTNNGVPVNKFWAERLRDSKLDNCMELVEPIKEKNSHTKLKKGV